MNCTKCGAVISPDSKFCEVCGSPVEAAAPAGNAGYDNYAQQNYSQPVYGQPNYNYSNMNQAQKPKSHYDGGVLGTLGAGLVSSFIITLTCGIATPWAVCYMYKFILDHMIIDGKRLNFDGTGGQLFGNWIKWFLLTLVTCGIYSLWVTPQLYDWIAKHTHFDNK